MRPKKRKQEVGNLLCVANFPANTAFAWDFIEGLYAGIADRLAPFGVETWVAYPKVSAPPKPLVGSAAEYIELPVRLQSLRSVLRVAREIRLRRIRTMYVCDLPAWNMAYALFKAAGVRRLILHDHTSGARTPPSPIKAAWKEVRRRLPGTDPDCHLAVSDFVVRRKVRVERIPPERVTRIWNSVEIPAPTTAEDRAELRARFNLPEEGPIVGCAARAVPEKGVHHLFRAFDQLCDRSSGPTPSLVYFGDGPHFDRLNALQQKLRHPAQVRLPGYVERARHWLGACTVAVVPSVWEEAFGLSALEPMAAGVPVIASNVGGIPEVVRDGLEGFLVPPGDETALAEALEKLLGDSELRTTLGTRGRARAVECFSREKQLDVLVRIVENKHRP